MLKWLRWSAVAVLLVMGILDFYYGNFNAGFYENLWYITGGIYIFAALIIAANIEPHFSQLTIFAYSLFLLVVWATVAFETGSGLDAVAYADKIVEAILAVNMVLLFRNSRMPVKL